MKYMLLLFFLQLFFFYCFSQSSSNDGVEHENVEIPANISDWHSTKIMVKKGDWISLDVSGIISVGLFAGDVNAAGSENPFLVSYSRYKEIPHGALICKNDDEIIAAQTKYKFQATNNLKQCLPDFDFLPNDFTGNLFISKSDQELKFLINDADYSNNAGSFNVSINIYHNYFPQVGDVVIYYAPNGGITHSGYVTQIDGCKVIGINCYLQRPSTTILTYPISNDTLLKNVNPDTLLLTDRFGQWIVYHTNRPYSRKLKTISITRSQLPNPPPEPPEPDLVTEGITDQNRLIAYFHLYDKKTLSELDLHYRDYTSTRYYPGTNCHGYTFDCINIDENKYKFKSFWNGWDYEYQYYEIAGYADKKGNGFTWHVSKSNNDQAGAVGFILHDNGYKQVHAAGSDGSEHFQPQYEIK